MPSPRFLLTAIVLVLGVGVARGGDVGGDWRAEFTAPNGQEREVTFRLVADGDRLTGTVTGPRGETSIEDGTVSGETLAFSVTREFRRGEVTFLYRGTVTGDEIPLTVTIEGRDRTFEMTARRVEE